MFRVKEMFNDYFVDLHIHIGGGSGGEPVKITASRKLNFANILKESLYHKGLNMIGIIDCASPVVIRDMEILMARGEMKEIPDGGIQYGDLVVIPGAEVESREDNGGQAHYLGYFPGLKEIKEYSLIMKEYITNINLSSQSTGLSGREIFKIIEATGGICVPAHVFTPHKSFYGRSFKSFKEVFTSAEWKKIPAIELGLSADTILANYLDELKDKSYLSNSDAHSLGKIAREYNIIRMKDLSFKELKMALFQENGRKIVANYGLDPRLGKYHRSFCPDCEKNYPFVKPVFNCPECGNTKLIIGVKDRIIDISDKGQSILQNNRAPYIYQIPLSDIPGIGRKTLEKLLHVFATEMNIIHRTRREELENVVNSRIVDNIIKARTGELSIQSGGGGLYGKVMG